MTPLLAVIPFLTLVLTVRGCQTELDCATQPSSASSTVRQDRESSFHVLID